MWSTFATSCGQPPWTPWRMSISCRSSWLSYLLTKDQNHHNKKTPFQYFKQTRFYLMLPFQCLMETDLYKLLKTQRLSNDHICYFLYQVGCVSCWGWWCIWYQVLPSRTPNVFLITAAVFKKRVPKRCNSCNFWSAKISQIWLDLLPLQNIFFWESPVEDTFLARQDESPQSTSSPCDQTSFRVGPSINIRIYIQNVC